jgi:polyhydroxybutyrate depolymerase
MHHRSFVARIFAWLVCGTLLLGLTSARPVDASNGLTPGVYVSHVTVGGREREYRLLVPAHYDGRRALPAVLVFHGSSASAWVIERETSFDVLADARDFFVIYPEGTRRAWNIGECCRYAYRSRQDETAFVAAILAQLRGNFRIDSTRIYATGYSDGATLSYLLACAMPNRLAAVAGISGTLFSPEPRCALPRPVSALVIHGTGDQSIPYNGQSGVPASAKGVHFNASAPAVAKFWAVRDRCDAPSAPIRHGNVERMVYDCPHGGDVELYTIYGGAHGWPGGGRGWIFSPLPPNDMSATDTVVAFFLRHRLGETMQKPVQASVRAAAKPS